MKVKITETYVYYVDVDASNVKEAINKVKEEYKNADDGVIGVANALSLESTKFKVVKD